MLGAEADVNGILPFDDSDELDRVLSLLVLHPHAGAIHREAPGPRPRRAVLNSMLILNVPPSTRPCR